MSDYCDQQLAPLRAWLGERRGVDPAIDLDVDLIDSRLVDSLAFVDLVYLVEQLTGREIVMSEVTLDAFRTLRAIHTNFFPQASTRHEHGTLPGP